MINRSTQNLKQNPDNLTNILQVFQNHKNNLKFKI